jgi:hypothetical protein
MFTWAITIAALSILYGLAWHDQPAREEQGLRQATGSAVRKLNNSPVEEPETGIRK